MKVYEFFDVLCNLKHDNLELNLSKRYLIYKIELDKASSNESQLIND